MIKFGNRQFNNWELYSRNGISGWFKRTLYGSEHIIIAPHSIEPNIWHIEIGYDLTFLYQFFDEDILTGTAEEVKQKVDDVLLRLGKLVSFI